MAGATEIEQRLLNEAVRQRQRSGERSGEEGAALSIEETRGFLPIEEQTAIRNRACNLAWEQMALPETLDSQPDSAARRLGDAIAQMQEEIQPRARLAARALDDFLREKIGPPSRNGHDQEASLGKLPPDDARRWREMEAFAAGTREELYRGFEALDRLRREVEESRNGRKDEPVRVIAGIANAEHRIEVVETIDHAASPSNGHSGDTELLSRWFREMANAYSALDSWGREAQESFAGDPERLRGRCILGQAIETKARREIAELKLDLALESGDTFRFRVRDQSGAETREISEFDVRRRANARGARAADEEQIHTALERRETQQQTAGRDLALHAETLRELGERRQRLIDRLEREFRAATREEADANARAQTVEEKYADRREPLPAPLLDRNTLAELQEQAISHNLIERIEQLEDLRLALAEEHGQPARTEREASRLAAQLFTARTELAAREERAARFDQARHLRQWAIGNEKWSLADLDRRIERQTDDAKLLGKYQLHLDPNVRRQAGDEVERLTAIRETVVGSIAAEQHEMQEEVQEAGRLLNALTRIYERESAFRTRSGQAMPEPLFTRKELERVAANAEVTRDAAILRQLHEFEKRSNADGTPVVSASPERELGRALAREAMAGISLRESAERLANFQARSELQPLLIETPDGRLLTKRLDDTKPDSLAERVLRPLIERESDRELHDAIRAAFAQYHDHLLSGHEKSLSYSATAHEITELLREEAKDRASAERAAPDFTPKERINIEIYAERLTDPNERESYLRLARGETTPERLSRDLTERASGSDHDRSLARTAHQFLSRGAGHGR
jgi:hypothetical protein